MSPHVVIVGSGIAGLSLAHALAKHGLRVTILEKEPLPFSHSSGRNAAIYRPLEASQAVTELAQRSFALVAALGSEAPLLDARGLTLTAKAPASLRLLESRAQECGVRHQVFDEQGLIDQHPELRGGRGGCGLHLPSGGVLDIHAIAEQLRKSVLSSGVALRTGVDVREISMNSGGAVQGVLLADGSRVAGSQIVVAAGAWSERLLKTCDVHVPLVPHRRHLALLTVPAGVRLPRSVAWDVETGVYLRAESGGLLACPGDHTPSEPGLPAVDAAQLVALAQRLPLLAPSFRDSEVKTAWACLRTMSPDQDMLAGAVKSHDGLWIYSGLAGHGMSTGLAGGQLLAEALLGRSVPLLDQLSPDRFSSAGLELGDCEGTQ